MASNARDWWRQHRQSSAFMIASPSEADEQRSAMARNCTEEGARAGAKAAAITFVASAIPTIIGVRNIPWARANLNYTAQALIVSGATVAAYFIVSDQTILECARETSYQKIQADRAAAAAAKKNS